MTMPVMTSMPATVSSTPPNVCKVPPTAVPTPMTSMGLSSATLTTTQAFTIYTVGCPTSVMGSTMSSTLPVDAAGTMLGNTGFISGSAVCTLGATRIFKNGKGTAVLTSSHSMNAMNTTGLTASSSQTKVLCCP